MSSALRSAADELWINDDISVGDLTTEEECVNAFQLVTAQIVSIEGQISDYTAGQSSMDGEWHKRARGALRFKRAALNAIQTRRGEISRAAKAAAQRLRDDRFEHHFIRSVQQIAPDVYELACSEANRRMREEAA